MDDITGENLEWINAREVTRPKARPMPLPKIDKIISEIVGKQILINDPKLIKLIAKWKREKQGGEDEFDEFLTDGAKVEELKKTLNPERYAVKQ